MATTTNYGWTTPDDTALVKDGAAAIRTLGSSVDTTTKALNPSTTLGDIEYRSSTANTNTRLGIGSTGNVLTVAGGVPSWAAPAGGGSNWSLLNAGGTALTGASTITVSGISGQNSLFIYVKNASSVNGNSFMRIIFNSDSGSNYDTAGLQMNTESTYQSGNFVGSGGNDTFFKIGRMNTSASGNVITGITVSGANTSGIKVVNVIGGGDNNGSNNDKIINAYNGFYAGSSTISSVSIISSTGDFDFGTIFVYGSAV
jgi:hypothetical protein